MYVLNILRTGSTGDLKAKLECLIGLKQVEQTLLKVTWKKMGQQLAEGAFGREAALAGIRQFAKSLGIQITKRKALQAIPLVGALVGASFNAAFVNDIGRAAYMSYRRRWIADIERQQRGDDPAAPGLIACFRRVRMNLLARLWRIGRSLVRPCAKMTGV